MECLINCFKLRRSIVFIGQKGNFKAPLGATCLLLI
jgi:hypothetical protein